MKDFTTPNARALTAMDCYLQNSIASKAWERSSISSFFTGDTWEDIEANDPRSFKGAWLLALTFMNNYDLEFGDELNNWY